MLFLVKRLCKNFGCVHTNPRPLFFPNFLFFRFSMRTVDYREMDIEGRDPNLRVRCCNRYELYAKVFTFFVFLVSVIIYCVIKLAHLSKHVHDTMELAMLGSLFILSLIFTVYFYVKIFVVQVAGGMCMIPYCCGCNWIERHQLRFERMNEP